MILFYFRKKNLLIMAGKAKLGSLISATKCVQIGDPNKEWLYILKAFKKPYILRAECIVGRS